MRTVTIALLLPIIFSCSNNDFYKEPIPYIVEPPDVMYWKIHKNKNRWHIAFFANRFADPFLHNLYIYYEIDFNNKSYISLPPTIGGGYIMEKAEGQTYYFNNMSYDNKNLRISSKNNVIWTKDTFTIYNRETQVLKYFIQSSDRITYLHRLGNLKEKIDINSISTNEIKITLPLTSQNSSVTLENSTFVRTYTNFVSTNTKKISKQIIDLYCQSCGKEFRSKRGQSVRRYIKKYFTESSKSKQRQKIIIYNKTNNKTISLFFPRSRNEKTLFVTCKRTLLHFLKFRQ